MPRQSDTESPWALHGLVLAPFQAATSLVGSDRRAVKTKLPNDRRSSLTDEALRERGIARVDLPRAACLRRCDT